ncbi:MAG: PIN domain-containing protein [Chloroflexi bacterium]|nr:PIN domain-containing protein [Chloroflexota bacterium]
MSDFTVDSSFIVKGLVPVRRTKTDDLRARQMREYEIASEYLNAIRVGAHRMFVPAIARVEVVAVISRLTNSREDAQDGSDFVLQNAARIYYDTDLLDRAIETAIIAKTGGYDTIFLTVAKMTSSTLLTADRIQHDMAIKTGIKSMLLSDLLGTRD